MITSQHLDNLVGKQNPLLVNPYPQFTPMVSDTEKFQRELWDSERMEQTKTRLHRHLLRNDIQPPDEGELQTRLDDWWRVEGQNLPRFVLDEIGVSGGDTVPTFEQRLQQLAGDKRIEARERSKMLKEALEIDKEYDPLDDYLLEDLQVDPSSGMPIKAAKKPTPTIAEKLIGYDDESLRAISNIVIDDPMEFPPGILNEVDRELMVRQHKDNFYDLLAEDWRKAAAVLMGTQFANAITIPGGILDWMSKRGYDPLDPSPGDRSAFIEAAKRIRAEALGENPTFLQRVGMESGQITADIIKFWAMPNPAKISVFAKLSPTVKGAIGIGTKSALLEALRVSEEGETIADRVVRVGAAGTAGASVGAVFGLGETILKNLAVKSTRQLITGEITPQKQAFFRTLRPEQIKSLDLAMKDASLFNAGKMTLKEWTKRHAEFMNLLGRDFEAFVKPPMKTGLPRGARAGFAELGGEPTKKALAWAKKHGLPEGATSNAIRRAITDALSKGIAVPPDVTMWADAAGKLPENIESEYDIYRKAFAHATDEEVAKMAVEDGIPVPEETLRQFAGKKWADEALEIYPVEVPPTLEVVAPKPEIADTRKRSELPEGHVKRFIDSKAYPTDSIHEKYEMLVKGAMHKDPEIRKRNQSKEFFDEMMKFSAQDYKTAETYNVKLPTYEQFIADVKARLAEAPAPKPVEPPKKPAAKLEVVSPETAKPITSIPDAPDAPTQAILVDPEAITKIKGLEKEVGKLTGQLEAAKAAKQTDVAKAIEKEREKKQVEIARIKERHAVKLAKTIDQHKERIQKIRNASAFKDELREDALSMIRAIDPDLRKDFITRAMRVKTLKGVDKLAAEIDKAVEKFEKRAAVGELREAFKGIEKNYRLGKVRLGKLPSPQREQMLRLMDGIDTKKLTDAKTEDLESLQQFTQKIASQLAGNLEGLDDAVESSLRLPNERVRQLNRLSQRNVNDMTVDDIRMVTESLMNTLRQAELKSALLTKKGLEGIDGAVKKIVGEIATRPSVEKAIKKDLPLETDDTLFERWKRGIKRSAVLDDMHLDTLVERVTHLGPSKLRDLLDTDLHRGLLESYTVLTDWLSQSQAEFGRLGLTSTAQLDKKVKVVLGGKKINLSLDHLLKLEMHSRSPDNLKAILHTKGWRIGNQRIEYTDDIDRLAELRNALKVVRDDPMLMGLADWTAKMNQQQAKAINATSELLNGHPIARDAHYTSRPRDLPYRVEGQKDISVPPDQLGRYQPREGGTQRMVLDAWTDDYLSGLESDAVYHGMSIPLRNARIVMSSDAVQMALRNAGLDSEMMNIILLLRRIQGVTTSKSALEVFGGHIQQAFTTAALGARISTMGTQVMSYPAAAAETGITHLKPPVFIKQGVIDRISQDSAIMDIRWKGRRVGIEMGHVATQDSFDMLFFGQSKRLSNKSMVGLMYGDQQAIGNIYQQLVVPEIRRVPRNGKNIHIEDWNGRDVADLPPMDNPEAMPFRQAAARRLEYVVRRTQPMYDMLDRSVTLSNPSFFERSFFMFRTALEAQENILFRAHDAYLKTGRTLADKRKYAGDVSSVVTAAVAVAAWKRAFKWAIAYGVTAGLATLGIFKFKEPREAEEVLKDTAWDTVKNIGALNKYGQFIIRASEQVAGSIWGEGYNYNRETFESPFLESLQAGADAIVVGARVLHNVTLLDEFVEEFNKLDVQHNERLAEKFGKDFVNFTRSVFNAGTRLGGIPILAPTQEFINPLLRDSNIQFIREITFSDTKDPQALAERVWQLDTLRRGLNSKARKTRLNEDEDVALIGLNRLNSALNRVADNLRETSDLETRRLRIEDVQRELDSFEERLKEMGVNWKDYK